MNEAGGAADPVGELFAQSEASLDFSVSMVDQQAFSVLSGDFNPLHLDPGFARERGLAGPVVYGGMMVAKISNLIGMRLPGSSGIWSSLKIDFREPLYVDEAARLVAEISHYSEAMRSLSLKLRITCGERLIATGSVLATLHAR